MGDRTSLDLIGRQDELVEAMVALGKPIIAFLFNGRPLSINHLIAHVPVIFECFYLGQETGHAVADVLFGDYNPGGKLPISFPRSVGHLPVFYNYKPSARRGYLFDDVSPLFAFGYGLSYTTFELDEPAPHQKENHHEGHNAGAGGRHQHRQARRRRDRAALHPRPRQLRYAPDQGAQGLQAKSASSPAKPPPSPSTSRPDSLAFYDVNMKHVVEPGDFEIMIGTSSRDADLHKLTLQVTK